MSYYSIINIIGALWPCVDSSRFQIPVATLDNQIHGIPLPDVELRIASKPEEAHLEDTIADEDLRVYSDGSAIDGGIGGAAVLMEGDRMVDERRFYLGKTEEHTVYEGEIVGMILAVELLRERMRRRGRARPTMALGVDNQAAIRATGGFQSKPGHYLIDIFHDDLRRLLPRNDDHKLIIRWSAGHIGIPGNEAADAQTPYIPLQCRQYPHPTPMQQIGNKASLSQRHCARDSIHPPDISQIRTIQRGRPILPLQRFRNTGREAPQTPRIIANPITNRTRTVEQTPLSHLESPLPTMPILP